MHYTQAFSLLPLFLLTPLTLAAPAAEPQTPNPPPSCPLGKTPFGCPFPDHQPVDPSFVGFQGNFASSGFPYYLDSPTQPLVCPGRLDDTVRRALDTERIADSYDDYVNAKKGAPENLAHCVGSLTPIFQGTTYVGDQQIFITWDQDKFHDPTNQVVTYCGFESPTHDSQEHSVPGCTIPIPP